MKAFWLYLKANWKTNLAALCAFLITVPEFVTAIRAWQAGQHPDWRGAMISLVIAVGLAAAKDGTNHSTLAQVENATIAKPAVQLQAQVNPPTRPTL